MCLHYTTLCAFIAALVANEVSCLYPLFDYVPPELITLIISNMFG